MNARAAFVERGRLVRDVAERHTLTENDFLALVQAGDFNRAHPDIAIPSPVQVLGLHLPVCAHCQGEGSMLDKDVETLCQFCRGSGFAGVRGYGAKATGNLRLP